MQFQKKHHFSAWQDAEIKRVYSNKQRGGNKRLALEFGVSASLISLRAAKLGLHALHRSHQRQTPASWKTAELKIVESHLGLPILTIRAALAEKGYQRDEASIQRLIYHRRMRSEWPTLAELVSDQDCLLLTEIIAGMGITRDQLQRWIQQGWLKAEKRQGGDGIWVVRRKDLRKTLRAYAAHWDHCRADKWFLLDVLCGEEIG